MTPSKPDRLTPSAPIQTIVSVIALLVAAPIAPAQTASTPPAPATEAPADPDEEDVITLSPFIVDSGRETGWSANDTLSASRTKQALKDVPVNIDAITTDFMKDLALDSADEVALFVANVYALPIMENDNHKGNFSFRGLSQTNNVSRNYFRWYIPSDTYNVERLDFGKGSNSLIFGEVEPGGNGAAFTKRPRMQNFGEASAFVNSEGAYRYLIDLNYKVRDGLAFRFNANRSMRKTFQDASDYKFEGETIAMLWQPLKTTALRLEYEQGKYDNVRGFAGIYVRERSARGRGFTGSSAGTFYTSDGVWVIQSQLPSIDRASSSAPAGGQPSLLEGEYFDVQMQNASGAIVGTTRVYGLPKHYNIRGAFDNHARPFHTFSATLNQDFGPISTEFAYNYQTQSEQRNDNAFDQVISLDVNGRPYIDSNLDRKHFDNEVHAFRGSAAYRFKSVEWMEQLLVVTGEYREDQALNTRWQYYNIRNVENGTATAINTSADRGRLRVYLDDPRFYSRQLFDSMRPEVLPDTATVNMEPLRLFASGSSAADGTEWRQASAVSISASGRYLDGRLQSLLGARTDWGRLYEYVPTRKEGPWNEDVVAPPRKDSEPGDYVENEYMHQSDTTYTAGLTFALTKEVNLYAIYSESFRFQDARTFDRVPIGPITGVTNEIGLKGSLWDNKATFTLGVFDIDRQNAVRSWNNVVNFTDTQTEDLMNPNDVLPGDPDYKYREPGTASASRNYTATENSTGWDLTLMVRPAQGLQLRLTVGYADVKSDPDLESFRAYYDAALLRPDESPAMLADAKNLLDTLDIEDSSTGARAAPWSASWVVDYGFPKDSPVLLQGVRMGINGSWRDDYLFGVPGGEEMVGGSTHLVSAYIMRDQKLWGRQPLRVRLGVKNLVDLSNSGTRTTSFTTLLNGQNVYRYSYVMPPQYDLTVSLNF